MGEFFIKLDTIVWSNPIIFFNFRFGSIFYDHFKRSSGSKYQASDSVYYSEQMIQMQEFHHLQHFFCTVIGYRVWYGQMLPELR